MLVQLRDGSVSVCERCVAGSEIDREPCDERFCGECYHNGCVVFAQQQCVQILCESVVVHFVC